MVGNRLERPDRKTVVRREDCRWRTGERQQTVRTTIPLGHVIFVGSGDIMFRDDQTDSCGNLTECQEPVDAGRYLLRAGDMGDPPVAGFEQEIEHGGNSCRIVVDHRRRIVEIKAPVHGHDRHVLLPKLAEGRIVTLDCGVDDAVDTVLQKNLHLRPFPIPPSIGIHDDRHISQRLECTFDPPHDRRKKGVGQVGNDQSDGLGPSRAQTRRQPVGTISQPRCGLRDPVHHFGRQCLTRLRVEGPGHRRDMDIRLPRDILEGHGPALPLSHVHLSRHKPRFRSPLIG